MRLEPIPWKPCRRNQPNHKTLKPWILLIFGVQVRPRKLFTDPESFRFTTNILDFMAVWNFWNFEKFWEFCNVWKVITPIVFWEKRWSWYQSSSFNLGNLMEQKNWIIIIIDVSKGWKGWLGWLEGWPKSLVTRERLLIDWSGIRPFRSLRV